tara:strand:- start:480 stop:695 length:216 start_codon:yes stop_codon:yes gene_type:complete
MRTKKVRVPVIQIIRILLPAIKATVQGIAAAREIDSDGGKKVTKGEWEDILAEALLELVPDIADELKKANS